MVISKVQLTRRVLRSLFFSLIATIIGCSGVESNEITNAAKPKIDYTEDTIKLKEQSILSKHHQTKSRYWEILNNSNNDIKSIQKIYNSLKPLIIGDSYVGNTDVDQEKLSNLLSIFNQAAIILLESKKYSEKKKSAIIDDLVNKVFENCDRNKYGVDVLVNCTMFPFFQKDSKTAKIIGLRVRQIHAILERNKPQLSIEKRKKLLKQLYNTLYFSTHIISAGGANDILRIIHTTYAKDIGALLEDKVVFNSSTSEVKRRRFCSMAETNIKNFGFERVISKEIELKLYAYLDSIKPYDLVAQENLCDIDKSQLSIKWFNERMLVDGKINDSWIPNYFLDQKDESSIVKVQQQLKSHGNIANFYGVSEKLNQDIYLYIVDGLFQRTVSDHLALAVWKGLKSQSDLNLLKQTIEKYLRIRLADLTIDTYKHMAQFYLFDDHSPTTVFADAMRHGKKFEAKWLTYKERVEDFRRFMTQIYSSKQNEKRELQIFSNRLSRISKDIEVSVDIPQMIILAHRVVQLGSTQEQADEFLHADFQIELDEIFKILVSGKFDKQYWFSYGENSGISSSDVFHAFSFLANSSIDLIRVKDPADTSKPVKYKKFSDLVSLRDIFQSYFSNEISESLSSLKGTAHKLKANSLGFNQALNLCSNLPSLKYNQQTIALSKSSELLFNSSKDWMSKFKEFFIDISPSGDTKPRTAAKTLDFINRDVSISLSKLSAIKEIINQDMDSIEQNKMLNDAYTTVESIYRVAKSNSLKISRSNCFLNLHKEELRRRMQRFAMEEEYLKNVHAGLILKVIAKNNGNLADQMPTNWQIEAFVNKQESKTSTRKDVIDRAIRIINLAENYQLGWQNIDILFGVQSFDPRVEKSNSKVYIDKLNVGKNKKDRFRNSYAIEEESLRPDETLLSEISQVFYYRKFEFDLRTKLYVEEGFDLFSKNGDSPRFEPIAPNTRIAVESDFVRYRNDANRKVVKIPLSPQSSFINQALNDGLSGRSDSSIATMFGSKPIEL